MTMMAAEDATEEAVYDAAEAAEGTERIVKCCKHISGGCCFFLECRKYKTLREVCRQICRQR